MKQRRELRVRRARCGRRHRPRQRRDRLAVRLHCRRPDGHGEPDRRRDRHCGHDDCGAPESWRRSRRRPEHRRAPVRVSLVLPPVRRHRVFLAHVRADAACRCTGRDAVRARRRRRTHRPPSMAGTRAARRTGPPAASSPDHTNGTGRTRRTPVARSSPERHGRGWPTTSRPRVRRRHTRQPELRRGRRMVQVIHRNHSVTPFFRIPSRNPATTADTRSRTPIFVNMTCAPFFTVSGARYSCAPICR